MIALLIILGILAIPVATVLVVFLNALIEVSSILTTLVEKFVEWMDK